MIKKLRIKMVIAAMCSLIAVLAVILGAAGILNYRNIVTEADQKLQMLADNGGAFPDKLESSLHKFSPELQYETRYFYVNLNSDESVQTVNVGQIAAVDAEQAVSYAEEVAESGSTKGFVDSYRYLVYTDARGEKGILFLSCYSELKSFQKFLLNGSIMAVCGSLAVLLILIVLSQRIVKPVSDSYEKQKRFITDAGHELKTPLTIISADAEVLEMDCGENEWLNDIRTQTQRLTDLTNSLVYLARMEEQAHVEYLDFSLSDTTQHVADEFETVAMMQGKKLTSSVEPDLILNGDEKAIQRLVTILLDNAVKYAGEKGQIQVALNRWRGQIRLQVYNTTDHIDRDSLEHLFDRFYRTDLSRNSQTGGYGLGLSIASAIVSSHHGKISAATEDEQSLTITVTFPI